MLFRSEELEVLEERANDSGEVLVLGEGARQRLRVPQHLVHAAEVLPPPFLAPRQLREGGLLRRASLAGVRLPLGASPLRVHRGQRDGEPARRPHDAAAAGDAKGGKKDEKKGGKKKKEVYKYEAPWTVYSMNWSIRPDRGLRLAVGSFIEDYDNKVQVVALNEEQSATADRVLRGESAFLTGVEVGRLKDSGARLSFVGVGQSVSRNVLRRWASWPWEIGRASCRERV